MKCLTRPVKYTTSSGDITGTREAPHDVIAVRLRGEIGGSWNRDALLKKDKGGRRLDPGTKFSC